MWASMVRRFSICCSSGPPLSAETGSKPAVKALMGSGRRDGGGGGDGGEGNKKKGGGLRAEGAGPRPRATSHAHGASPRVRQAGQGALGPAGAECDRWRRTQAPWGTQLLGPGRARNRGGRSGPATADARQRWCQGHPNPNSGTRPHSHAHGSSAPLQVIGLRVPSARRGGSAGRLGCAARGSRTRRLGAVQARGPCAVGFG